MSEWEVVTIEEVASFIKSGGTPSRKKPEYFGGDIPWLTTKEVDFNNISDTQEKITEDGLSNSSAKWVPEGATIIAMYGATAGKVCRSKIPLTTNQACCNIVVDPSLGNDEFLFYQLWSRNNELVNLATGAAQQNLSVGTIKEFPITLPPLQEQHAIAEVLSSLDDKIDLLKRQNKTLEGMAEALFRQWFIEEAQNDWGNSTLEHLIETTVGGEWGKESPQGDFVHKCLCMRGTDIADFANGDSQRTPERYLKESKVNKTRVTHGDLIIEISGGTDDQSTGRTFLYANSARPLFPSTLVFSNFCRLIRPRIPELGTFLHFFIKYLFEKKFLFNLENGTSGIKNLDYKVLLFFEKFRLPPEGRMIEFHGQYVPLSDKIIANRIEIINLQKIRDTLLPKLMSGEVRVQMD